MPEIKFKIEIRESEDEIKVESETLNDDGKALKIETKYFKFSDDEAIRTLN